MLVLKNFVRDFYFLFCFVLGFVCLGFFVSLGFLCDFNLFWFVWGFFANKMKAGDLFGQLYILLAVYFPSETKSHAKFPIGSQRNLSVGVGAMLAIYKRRQ